MQRDVQKMDALVAELQSKIDEHGATALGGAHLDLSNHAGRIYDAFKALKRRINEPVKRADRAQEIVRDVRSGMFDCDDLASLVDHSHDHPFAMDALHTLLVMREPCLINGAAHSDIPRNLVLFLDNYESDNRRCHKALAALTLMAKECDGAKASILAHPDAARLLVDLLEDGDGYNMHVDKVAVLVAELAKNSPDSRKRLGDQEGLIRELVKQLHFVDSDLDDKTQVANALVHLTDGNDDNKTAIINAGAVPHLREIRENPGLEEEALHIVRAALARFA